MLPGDLVEQNLGAVAVGEPEEVEGIRLTTVDVGNPHAVVEGDPAELPRIGPLLEVHERFPRPHERAGGAADAAAGSRRESGSAGRGDGLVRLERRRGRRRVRLRARRRLVPGRRAAPSAGSATRRS